MLTDRWTDGRTNMLNCRDAIASKKSKEIFKDFFEAEAKIHGNDESKIFLSFHLHLDPALVDPIVVTKIPGITQMLIHYMEALFCSKWITWLQDKIIEQEWLSELIATIFTIAKIIASFTDLFKAVSTTTLHIQCYYINVVKM